MKNLVLFLFLACSACSTAPSVQIPKDWTLVWSDDFSGTSLNPVKWKILSRIRGDAVDDPSSVSVSKGLKITTFTDQGKNFTGFLSTQNLFQPVYGYFEASINFHDAPGEWCAFWIQSPTIEQAGGNPEKTGVEIDISEHRFSKGSTVIKDSSSMGALHWDYGPSHKDVDSHLIGSANGQSLQSHFHTYGVLWTKAGYQFYLDGNMVVSHPPSEAPVSQTNEFIYLSCEVKGRGWAGEIPPGGYGSRANSQTGMDVAWVRVWGPSK